MKTAELSEKAKIKCSKCKIAKPAGEFHKACVACKKCESLRKKEAYIRAKTKPKKFLASKICVSCKKQKKIKNFPVYPHSKNGHANICWKCKGNREKLNNNPDKYWWRKACITNRRGKKKTSGALLKSIYENQNKKCVYCNIDLNQDNIAIDHKKPISKKGDNRKNNLQITCKDCNLLKFDKTDKEFKIFIMNYITRFDNANSNRRP